MFPIRKSPGFAQRAQASQPDRIFLVRGKDASGNPTWYYVLVDHGKQSGFESTSGSPSLDIGDYGTVLFSGYGSEPPADIRKRMEDEYGFTA